MKEFFEKALKNIIAFGDTDIFPFPFERLMIKDKFDDSVRILENYHNNLDDAISKSPPRYWVELSQVGYFGFRQATFIEPFWNAYFLALTISLAEKIEKNRIDLEENSVYSYRYQWDEDKNTLFKRTTWIDYKKECIKKSSRSKFILQTDISNFYGRINHHRLENALIFTGAEKHIIKKLMKLIGKFSETISHGLPVGGPASRILAELSLNDTDKHLQSKGIKFCRYADDYTFFCDSESEAYKTLIFLSKKLSNEKLSLQKSKTKIITTNEYINLHPHIDPQIDSNFSNDERKLLQLSIRFDPYAPDSEDHYKELKNTIIEIDIINILLKEVNKIKIDQTISKQAINSLSLLSKEQQEASIDILLRLENMVLFAPVFTTLMRTIRSIYNNVSDETKDKIDNSLINLFKSDNFIIKINMNVSYIIQILSLRNSVIKRNLFIELFDDSSIDSLIKRQIIIAMANWEEQFWLKDKLGLFNYLSTLERRAIIYSTYFLQEQGRHWRGHNKASFTNEENFVKEWCGDNIPQNKKIRV